MTGFAIYGAMFLGQYGAAMEAAQELINTTPDNLDVVGDDPMLRRGCSEHGP